MRSVDILIGMMEGQNHEWLAHVLYNKRTNGKRSTSTSIPGACLAVYFKLVALFYPMYSKNK